MALIAPVGGSGGETVAQDPAEEEEPTKIFGSRGLGQIADAIDKGRDRSSPSVTVTGGTTVPDVVGVDEETVEAGGGRTSTIGEETVTAEEALSQVTEIRGLQQILEAIRKGRTRSGRAITVTGGTTVPDVVGVDDETVEAGGGRVTTLEEETVTIDELLDDPGAAINRGNLRRARQTAETAADEAVTVVVEVVESAEDLAPDLGGLPRLLKWVVLLLAAGLALWLVRPILELVASAAGD